MKHENRTSQPIFSLIMLQAKQQRTQRTTQTLRDMKSATRKEAFLHVSASLQCPLIQTQAVNHAILTLKPIPSIPLLQQYSFSVPYLDAYSSICFRVRARIRGAAIFLLVVLAASSLGGAFGVRYCRRTVWTAALPQKGKMLFPTRMPIPPSGPEEARLWLQSAILVSLILGIRDRKRAQLTHGTRGKELSTGMDGSIPLLFRVNVGKSLPGSNG